ncbi:polysaccharide deacetylase [Leptospira tipperaryensis]|uniref:Polysaccharide deacetylase n=1 Tax=Leptospira tipperaryensis TaxID=2564040 RepID=A0A1D7UVX3_9LEPT|nr:polysaccharide deacetylase family protein [Leptospira tipperaryensis]AOP33703.1 polysaccharide deacetylase [Leptospira tipperaryensis]
MSILHNILASTYLPWKTYNALGKALRFKKNSELRVLLYHDIPIQEQSLFRSQLVRISKDWNFVSPEIFSLMIKGKREIVGRNILLTFDDGYLSNRRVAEEVLKPLGIQALFFIIADFVDVQNEKERKIFISQNVYPNFSPEQVPDSWIPMNWGDLKSLLYDGHFIGSHTRTHARLSKILDPIRLNDEIAVSKRILEEKLKVKIHHFAYTFGDLASFSPEALRIAKSHYEFVYTGLRGDNRNSPPWSIRRDAISPLDSHFLTGALLEGGADLLYRKKNQIYESWGRY